MGRAIALTLLLLAAAGGVDGAALASPLASLPGSFR